MPGRTPVLIGALALLPLMLAACAASAEVPDEASSAQADGNGAAGSATSDGEEAAADSGHAAPPLAEELTLPQGFAAVRWAEGFERPVALAISPDGRIILAEQGGRVWTLIDADNDGLADEPVLFARSEAGITGLAVLDDARLYLNEVGRLSLAEDQDGDGVADAVTPLLRGLPSSVHGVNGIAVAPGGRVLVALGSTCNDCRESNALAASVLAFEPDSGSLEVHASGLRNARGLAFDPDGALWATDAGSTASCPSQDELNALRPEVHYGWPYCADETAPFREQSGPVLPLGVDAGAAGLTWFDSPVFPAEFRGGFFITFSAASDSAPDAGSVQFAQRREDDRFELQHFAGGFGHPVAVVAGPRDSLYVADALRGVLYRVGPPLD